MRKTTKAIRRRLGPVGLSLAAAALTAIGFAAVSVAQDNGKGEGEGNGERGDRFEMHAPAPGARMFEELSGEDRQKLENFRECMQEQGAPAPPRFREGEGPPEPPSSEELERIRKAHEACRDELPEEMQDGPGVFHFGPGPCGPPPGMKRDGEDGEGSNQEQGYVIPAPAPNSAAS